MIDLVSSGKRGLETLDSISDLQNILKILNYNNNLINFHKYLFILNNSINKLSTYIVGENNVLPPPIGIDAKIYKSTIFPLPETSHIISKNNFI